MKLAVILTTLLVSASISFGQIEDFKLASFSSPPGLPTNIIETDSFWCIRVSFWESDLIVISKEKLKQEKAIHFEKDEYSSGKIHFSGNYYFEFTVKGSSPNSEERRGVQVRLVDFEESEDINDFIEVASKNQEYGLEWARSDVSISPDGNFLLLRIIPYGGSGETIIRNILYSRELERIHSFETDLQQKLTLAKVDNSGSIYFFTKDAKLIIYDSEKQYKKHIQEVVIDDTKLTNPIVKYIKGKLILTADNVSDTIYKVSMPVNYFPKDVNNLKFQIATSEIEKNKTLIMGDSNSYMDIIYNSRLIHGKNTQFYVDPELIVKLYSSEGELLRTSEVSQKGNAINRVKVIYDSSRVFVLYNLNKKDFTEENSEAVRKGKANKYEHGMNPKNAVTIIEGYNRVTGELIMYEKISDFINFDKKILPYLDSATISKNGKYIFLVATKNKRNHHLIMLKIP